MASSLLEKLTHFSEESWNIAKNSVSHIWKDHQLVLCSTITLGIGYYIYNSKTKNEQRLTWNSAGNDVVVLHGFSRGYDVPNVSPFVHKLETYLRMSKIKYIFEDEAPMGPKGKCPWITLNGEDFSDSQLIIESLSVKFSRDFTSNLTEEQKGAGKAIALMTAEHLFWGLEWWYFVKDPELSFSKVMPLSPMLKLFLHILKRKMKKFLYLQGLGRHTDAEVIGIIKKDLKAISQYLGTKQFLMGNEPSEYDCTVFGVLTQFIWAMPGSPFKRIIEDKFTNLVAYCERMKETFWPDWDGCLSSR